MIDCSLKSNFKKRKQDKINIAKSLFLFAKIDDKNANTSSQTLKFQSIRDYRTILINIYFYQHSRDLNTHFNSIIDVSLKSLIIAQ